MDIDRWFQLGSINMNNSLSTMRVEVIELGEDNQWKFICRYGFIPANMASYPLTC